MEEDNKKELQVENGNFTRIVNPLIDNLIKIPFKGCELAVALYIIRKTYGYHKTQDSISLTQFQKDLKRSRQTVITALENLKLVKVARLVKKGNAKGASNIWSINKYHTTWELVNMARLVQRNDKPSLTERLNLVQTARHTKDNTKDNKDIVAKATEPPKAKIDFKKYESLYLSLLAEYKLPPAMISYSKFRANLPKVLIYLESQNENIENYWRWYLDEFRFKEGGKDIFAIEKYGTEPSTTLSSYFVSKFIKEK